VSARPILLIVDDEERILNALSRSLRREGYTILTAQTAQRVRQLLEQHPVDVVLTDHKMPTASGLEILGLVSELRPDAARLLISGWPEQVPPDRLADLGVRELLPKPWDDGELKRALRSAFED